MAAQSRRDPFEEHAAAYEAWFEEHPLAYASELEAVRSLLPAGGLGVEIGSGTGRFATELGIDIGVEPAASMRTLAEERGLNVIDSTAESLPFASDSFDYVLMVTAVCFLRDVDQAFMEAFRILKNRGVFIVGIIDRTSPLGRRYERHRYDSIFYRDAHFHSTDEVAALMRDAGFTHLAFRQTLFGEPAEMEAADEIRDGHGEGAFVAIRGTKSR